MIDDDKAAKLALFDRPIAFHRSFLRLGVGPTGALLLSQAVYWTRKTSDPDGWFYKTMAEWEDEIGLTPEEQATARKRLVKAGVFHEKRQGIPCKLFFRVDVDELFDRLLKAIPRRSGGDDSAETPETDSFRGSRKQDTGDDGAKTPAKPKASRRKSRKQAADDAGSKPGGKPETITKTTAETTQEITAENSSGEGADAPSPGATETVAEPSPARPKVQIPEDMPGPKDSACKTYRAWANYAMKYRARYEVWPLWNASVAGQLSQLIDRVGQEEAPKIAAFYVTINDAKYIQRAHDMASLLRDVQSVRTQYLTGRQMNATTARQLEQTQANINAAQELMAQQQTAGGTGNAFLR